MEESTNNSRPTQEGHQRPAFCEKYWLAGIILFGLLFSLPGYLILTQMTHPNNDWFAANATVAFLIGMATIAMASLPAFVRSFPRIIRSAWSLWFARRPWLRFGLRTFFVLAMLLGVYLGWAMNWIQQREAYLQNSTPDLMVRLAKASYSSEEQSAPWGLRMLKERGVDCLFEWSAEEDKLQEVSRLFPEAKVFFCEVTNHGCRARAGVLWDGYPRLEVFPYYQNGKIFREEILYPVSDP